MEDLPPVFGQRFEVVEQIVERPSCRILKVTDSDLGGRELALKAFVDKPQGDTDLVDSFLKEVELLRAASHPVLVPIIHGGIDEGFLYIAMELIQGPSLRDVLKQEGQGFDVEVTVSIARMLGEALSELHDAGAIHAHIDSRAVLLKDEEPRLAGYYPRSVSRVQKNVTGDGRLIVDPVYIAPEQITDENSIDARVDVYGLSVLLFEMLSAERPFKGGNALQIAMKRLSEEPPSVRKFQKSVPALIDAALLKGMARDPKDRFSSIDELIDAITGGQKDVKNPLLKESSSEQPEALATETIAVSMSTESIREMLEAKAGLSSSTTVSDSSLDSPSPKDEGGDEAVLEADQTIIGMKSQELLCGSFVLLGGESRGERIFIEKEQSIIGRDPKCDIVLDGKDVSLRHAIVVRRENKFFVGSLSASDLLVNDEPLDAEEVILSRGDRLQIGKTKLRFVEPGEVYTVRDDIGESRQRASSARPGFYLTLAVMAVVALVSAGVWSFSSGVSDARLEAKKAAEQKARKRGKLIAQLKRAGDELLKSGSLIEPESENARGKFQQIVELDPEDSYAKRRLLEIEERLRKEGKEEKERRRLGERVKTLLAEAERYFERGDYVSPPGKNAKEAYQAVLRLDVDNEKAAKRIEEINNVLGDIVGRVESLLTDARKLMNQGHFVHPQSQNAFALLKKVQGLDPGNERAKEAILAMAALSVFQGDRAKAKRQTTKMERSYLTAQALGVEPEYINKRKRGAEMLKRARSSVIIVGGQKEEEEIESKPGYLDTAEIERRVARLKLKYGKSNANSILIDLDER